MDDDEYALITKKPLKLTKDKKDKIESSKDPLNVSAPYDAKLIITSTTKAEEAFKAKQEQIAEGRILKKASKTHKQRVEEFNKHLDSLSEHYDIPKVSWTK